MSSNQKMTSGYFRKYGFAPATVIDVGVLHGTFENPIAGE